MALDIDLLSRKIQTFLDKEFDINRGEWFFWWDTSKNGLSIAYEFLGNNKDKKEMVEAAYKFVVNVNYDVETILDRADYVTMNYYNTDIRDQVKWFVEALLVAANMIIERNAKRFRINYDDGTSNYLNGNWIGETKNYSNVKQKEIKKQSSVKIFIEATKGTKVNGKEYYDEFMKSVDSMMDGKFNDLPTWERAFWKKQARAMAKYQFKKNGK